MKWILDEMVGMGLAAWGANREFRSKYVGRVVTKSLGSWGRLGDLVGVLGRVRYSGDTLIYDYPRVSLVEVNEDRWVDLKQSMVMEIQDVWARVLNKKKYWKIKRKLVLSFEESGHWSANHEGLVVNIDPLFMFKMIVCVAYYENDLKKTHLGGTVAFVIEHELAHLMEDHGYSMAALHPMQRRALNIMTDMDINLGLRFRSPDFSKVLSGLGVFTHLPIVNMTEGAWAFVAEKFSGDYRWYPDFSSAGELYLGLMPAVRRLGKLEVFNRLVEVLEFLAKEGASVLDGDSLFGVEVEDTLPDSEGEDVFRNILGGNADVSEKSDEVQIWGVPGGCSENAVSEQLDRLSNLDLSDRALSSESVMCDIPKFSEIVQRLMRKTSDLNVRFSDEVLSRRLEGVWGEETDVYDHSNNILFLFDTSGSMNANSMVQAMSVFVYAVSNQAFRGMNKFYVGCWSDDLVLMEQVKAKSKEAMIKKTREFVEKGLKLGYNNQLLQSIKTLKSKLKKLDLIIHISDGEFYGFDEIEYLKYTQNMVNVIVGESRFTKTTFEQTHGGGVFVQGG